MTTPAITSTVPPPGATYLVTSGLGETLTARQETDALGALTRGLQEYLEQFPIDAFGGRKLYFNNVADQYEDREKPLKYPAASITLQGSGKYAPSSLTPVINKNQRLPEPDGRFLVKVAEMEATLAVEVFASDRDSRGQLVAMLESAMVPTTETFSLRLGLPHYFGLVGTFAMQDVTYEDAEGDVIRGSRKATMTVAAVVPVVKLLGLPMAKPRAIVETSLDVVVETQVS